MPATYRLQQLTFSDGTTVDAGNLIVFVGPNNSGKTRAIKDIVGHTCATSHDPVVVMNVTTIRPIAGPDLAGKYELVHRHHPPGHTTFHYLSTTLDAAGTTQLHGIWPKDFVKERFLQRPQDFSFFAQQLTGFLTTENRLRLVSECQSSQQTDQVANILQALYVAGVANEKQIRSVVSTAFPGLEVALDFTTPARLQFRVGTGFDKLPPDPRDARPILEACARLDAQGDGLRSYVGIVAALTALDRPVFLIDEPEAFLHPPQAHKLGKFIASQATDERQIVIATHSADVLRGIIFERPDVQVVRIDRRNNVNAVRLLPMGQLKQISFDPLLSAAGVLGGLFASGAIVTEADADSRFFLAVSNKLKPGADIHIVNADNKQTVPKVLAMYRALGVRCAGIVDIDVLNDQQEFLKQLESAGLTVEQSGVALGHRAAIALEVDSMPPMARLQRATDELSRLQAIIEMAKGLTTDEQNKALALLRSRLERLKSDVASWTELKKRGVEALTTSKTDFEAIDETCRKAGLFINRSGELEASLTQCGIEWASDKKAWITRALQLVGRLEVNPALEPWRLVSDVHHHLFS